MRPGIPGGRRALRQLLEHSARSKFAARCAANSHGVPRTHHFAKPMNAPRPQFFGMLAGLFLAAGLVFSSMLATATWLKVKNSQFITVKGSTRKNVTSDLIVWQGSFQVQAPALLDAEHQIQSNRAKVLNFLDAA